MSKGLINTSPGEKMPNFFIKKKRRKKPCSYDGHCIHKSLANLFHGTLQTCGSPDEQTCLLKSGSLESRPPWSMVGSCNSMPHIDEHEL